MRASAAQHQQGGHEQVLVESRYPHPHLSILQKFTLGDGSLQTSALRLQSIVQSRSLPVLSS